MTYAERFHKEAIKIDQDFRRAPFKLLLVFASHRFFYLFSAQGMNELPHKSGYPTPYAIYPEGEETPYMSAAANAINAQFSTGPRTPEGKERVKFNALKSGLFASTVVLPDEDQPVYDSLGVHLHDTWHPQTDIERELVLTIQNTTWRLNRVVELEFSLFAVGAEQQLASIEEQFGDQPLPARYALARAAAYVANLKAFDQISRQEGRLQRLLDRSRKEICAIVLLRPSVPQPAPRPQPAAEPIPTPAASTPAAPSGFVPSKYPADMPLFEGRHQGDRRRTWLRANGYKNLN